MEKTRGSGILLHITSLHSPFGIGDLGPGAYTFADFLSGSGQLYWQMLPLNPTDTALGNSPYSSGSAFAGNPLLISPELLVADRMLDGADLDGRPVFRDDAVDYEAVSAYKKMILRTAFDRHYEFIRKECAFTDFCRENAGWLDDYALFSTLKQEFGGTAWNTWPSELRFRTGDAFGTWRDRLSGKIEEVKFSQFLFFRQWAALRKYCNDRKIQIIGDIPIYVNYDSSDVWSNPDLFKLDAEKRPAFVAGVPPDYFSSTGQLWGNPVYNWDRLRDTGYAWWVARLEQNIRFFDYFRLDHFRGFVAFWEVAAGETTALNGRWVEVPAEDFFRTLFRRFSCFPMIAEDLGLITPDVREMIEKLGLPGMKVLLFAFGENLPVHPYAPHNFVKKCVAYTGTHDNNTIVGWFRSEAGPGEKERLAAYLGRQVPENEIPWEMIRLVMSSVAETVVIPMQDLLCLGEEGRMNHPSTSGGNWAWRLPSAALTEELRDRLLGMTRIYGRV